MRRMRLAAVLVLAASMTCVAAPGTRRPADSAPDVARRGQRLPNISNMPDALAGAPTNADVGDADSFGRAVNFLGFRQTEGVTIAADCTGLDPASCLTVTDPAVGASFSRIGDDAVIKLPGRAAKSLLCFTLTPLAEVQFYNPTSTPVNATGIFVANWRIESEVFNDPTLTNPATGLPLGGVISSGQTLGFESRRIEPNDRYQFVPFFSRSCISGNLSRRSLIGTYGLSEAQAREVFRKPITIRFGATAIGNYADVYSGYGVRIYGD